MSLADDAMRSCLMQRTALHRAALQTPRATSARPGASWASCSTSSARSSSIGTCWRPSGGQSPRQVGGSGRDGSGAGAGSGAGHPHVGQSCGRQSAKRCTLHSPSADLWECMCVPGKLQAGAPLAGRRPRAASTAPPLSWRWPTPPSCWRSSSGADPPSAARLLWALAGLADPPYCLCPHAAAPLMS